MFGIAGVFFGLLLGWVIGSHHAAPVRPAPAAPAESQPAQGQSQAPPLDESRAAALKETADRNPADAATRVQLGNLYFDHDRFADAARWYQNALEIDPRNVNVSTDLGITYYYMNQPDMALAQFDRSLQIEPDHSKTLLNVGIVRAFAKQDLEGAAKAWRRVVEVAPSSPEGDRARQALAGLRSAHPEAAGGGQGRGQGKPE
jgi:cytochrome c-type biogenesis protein CcmH/NrfG